MWNFQELLLMASLVGQKARFFSDDAHDEFKVNIGNGNLDGIFKVHAWPVIPFLEKGNLQLLTEVSSSVNTAPGFQTAIGALKKQPQGCAKALEIEATISNWQEVMKRNPERLTSSLDRVLMFSWLMDKGLQESFLLESLSEDVGTRVQQLFNRLVIAFGVAMPFYNLEAFVGDSSWLGSDAAISSSRTAGCLDVAALLLPAAMGRFVHATSGSWNGLTWDKIRSLADEILQTTSVEKCVILNLSRLAGVEPHHILFAANTLEFIPRRVGGKKADMPCVEALTRLVDVVTAERGKRTSLDVVQSANAVIRFRNWLPAIESQANFKGANWTYAAVCDTTSTLFQTLQDHPEVWKGEWYHRFHTILPQLKGLDATSAIGRCLLDFIQRGALKEKFNPKVDRNWCEAMIREACALTTPQNPTRVVYPQGRVGGKPHGLALTSHILGPEKVPEGFVLPVEAVEQVLQSDTVLWSQMRKLDYSLDLTEKESVAKTIQNLINAIQPPSWLITWIDEIVCKTNNNRWAVRTSSLVEGEARGVHKTMLDVSSERLIHALRMCISSYYAPEAVHFRFFKGEGDLPRMAVLFQPYLKMQGGVAEVRFNQDSTRYTVSVGATAADVTSGATPVSEWVGCSKKEAPEDIKAIIECLVKVSDIFGSVQLEWVWDITKQNPVILQMEPLPNKRERENTERSVGRWVDISSSSQIEDTKAILAESSDLVGLRLGQNLNLDQFQGGIMALVARYPRRIAAVRILERKFSRSSHFANILNFYEIEIVE